MLKKLVILLTYTAFINCIIEIPFKQFRVDGIPKFRNIHMRYPSNRFRSFLAKVDGNACISSNMLFMVNLKLGSTGQPFNLLLDTGSPYVWLARTGSHDHYPYPNHFNPELSKTAVNTKIPFKVSYGSGWASGVQYQDFFHYIENKPFKMLFGLATQTDFNLAGADGIIGLSHATKGRTSSFIENMLHSKVTSSRAFSFKFDKIIPGASGKLLIGIDEDFSKPNAISVNAIKESFFWQVPMNSFGMKNPRGLIESKKSVDIVLDSGTNSMVLPLDYLNELEGQLNKLNCQKIQAGPEAFTIGCKNLDDAPDFRFEINGHILIVPKRYLFVPDRGMFLANLAFTKAKHYLLGSPIFLAFHILFDKDNEIIKFYPYKNEFVEPARN